MTQISHSEVGGTEVSVTKPALTELGFPQVSPNQGSIIEGRFTRANSTQNSAVEVSSAQIGTFYPRSFEVSSAEIGVAQIGTVQVGFFQTSSSQVSVAQVNKGQIQIESTEIDEESKISFPSFISSEQLLLIRNEQLVSIHNSSFRPIDIINRTALYFWHDLLNFKTFDSSSRPTVFNIAIQINDLRAGQLAESQITSFDDRGIPNGGTILIDDDANGVGWFIDPTPTENSEFNQSRSDTGFRATNTSAANGYDLLTTILHEMGQSNSKFKIINSKLLPLSEERGLNNE